MVKSVANDFNSLEFSPTTAGAVFDTLALVSRNEGLLTADSQVKKFAHGVQQYLCVVWRTLKMHHADVTSVPSVLYVGCIECKNMKRDHVRRGDCTRVQCSSSDAFGPLI